MVSYRMLYPRLWRWWESSTCFPCFEEFDQGGAYSQSGGFGGYDGKGGLFVGRWDWVAGGINGEVDWGRV
jgi:hypothetical protein